MRKLEPLEQLLAEVAFASISVMAAILVRFVPRFAEMFREFGGELPSITRFLLPRWPMGIYALLCGVALMAGLYARKSWLMAAFFAGLIGVAFTFWALYAPIFELAGKIKAD
jgi:type II secretory pathway component PulF